ncbi:hypothetical protein [Halorientalis halophila]
MVWEVLIGFVLIVAGTYLGCTMALRGFFGREYYDPRTGESIEADGGSND